MPTQEPGELINYFISLADGGTVKVKSEILAKAKQFIFNKMSDEELMMFFVKNEQNFHNFMLLDIWTKSLDDSNGIVEFLEPYDIIEKIFSLFKTLPAFLDSFYPNLNFLLSQNKDEKVKHMIVKHLIAIINTTDSSNENFNDEQTNNRLGELLATLVGQIPNTSASYTKHLAELMCLVVMKSITVIEHNSNVQREIQRVAGLNETQSFRIMEIVVKLACTSNESLTRLCDQKLNLGEKIRFYLSPNNNDILAKLNCIELLVLLVDTEHGLSYLQQHGTLAEILQYLHRLDEDPFGMLLVPTIVKFFANIARKTPQLLLSNGDFATYYAFLFRMTSDADFTSDPNNLNLAIETFSYLFESKGVEKFFIDNFGRSFDELVDRLAQILKSSINDKLRANAVTCIAELISIEPSLLVSDANTDVKWAKSSSVSDAQLSAVSRQIYDKFVQKFASHENLFRLFLDHAKQPFEDKRLAAQLYFKALAQSDWGVRFLFRDNEFNRTEPTFLNGYLLNRSIELEKQGLESKYELIKLLVANIESNEGLIQLVGADRLQQLQAYVQEGPFFSRAQSRVAFENV